jgi:hypothetical protein
MNGRFWAANEDDLLRRLYANTRTSEIVKSLPGRSLTMVYQRAAKIGLRKSAKFLASPDACRLRPGDNVGAAFRFKKGQVPANKGLRSPGWFSGRMRETQFKKGDRTGAAARNWRPIGTVLIDSDGYQRIKVREHRGGEHSGFGNTKIWPLLQRYVWERARGPIPPGHAVIFKNGDKQDCVIGNLECLSRAELMRRNTIHRLPAPLKEVIMLKATIRATATRRRKKAA